MLQANSKAMLVRNPRSGEIDYSFDPPSATELKQLAVRLRAAQPAWEAMGIEKRIDVMRRWADALDERRAALIAAESADTGRFRISREIVGRTIANVRAWADVAPQRIAAAVHQGQSSIRPSVRFETQLRPYQLLGVISPWNAPLFLATIDAIPALLAGCAVLVKPSEIAPRFVDPLMEAVQAVPELAKVFAFVRGAAETGQQLIEEIDALCFTGSVPNGRKVGEACARRFIPAFLELGGKDAVIITATADLERAVQAALRGGVLNTGQICHSIERVYVHRSLYDRFVGRLVQEAEALKLSYPEDAGGHIGPFIMERQAGIVDAQLDDAIAHGARILTGGKSEVHGGGVYMRPTVVVDVTHDMKIMTEETFGPVLPVMPFDDEEQAIRLANDSEYGLSGAVIAGSAAEAHRIGERIDAGAITLQDTTLSNAVLLDTEKCYFGLSGLGEPRTGPSAILRYCRRKALIINAGEPVKMASLAEESLPARS